MKMKKLQKVISIFVVICMICALAVTTVLASGGPTLTVESVEAGRGDTVTIAVAAANNPGFTNFEWNIIYDKEMPDEIYGVATTEISAKALKARTVTKLVCDMILVPYEESGINWAKRTDKEKDELIKDTEESIGIRRCTIKEEF